jgi:hypothetical protein
VIFLFKESHFYADGLQVTTRCAIRGLSKTARGSGIRVTSPKPGLDPEKCGR